MMELRSVLVLDSERYYVQCLWNVGFFRLGMAAEFY